MIQVNYDPRELEALTHMIDLAVKAGGLNVAYMAANIHQKHITSLEAAKNAAIEEEKAAIERRANEAKEA